MHVKDQICNTEYNILKSLSPCQGVKELFTLVLPNNSTGFQNSPPRDGRENCVFLWLTIDVNFVTRRTNTASATHLLLFSGPMRLRNVAVAVCRPPPATWYSVSEWEEGSHSHHQNDKHLPACTPLFPGHHTLLEKDRQDLTIIAHLHCLLLQTLSRLFSEWQSSKNTALNKDHYYIRLTICSCLVRNEIIPMN